MEAVEVVVGGGRWREGGERGERWWGGGERWREIAGDTCFAPMAEI